MSLTERQMPHGLEWRRLVFLGCGVAIRILVVAWFVLPYDVTVGKVVGITFGLLPYIGLALAMPIIGSRIVFTAAAAVILGTDLHAVLGAIQSRSSTSGVALLVQPLFALFVVVPVAIVVGLLVARVSRVRNRV